MKVRDSLFAKSLAFCLALIFGVGSCITSELLLHFVDDVQIYRSDYRETSACKNTILSDANQIENYYALLQKDKSNTTLSTSEYNNLNYLKGLLYPPAGSNTAWAVVDISGETLLSNLPNSKNTTVEQIAAVTDGYYEQIHFKNYYVVIGLQSKMLISDSYSQNNNNFILAKRWFSILILCTVLCVLLCILLYSFLLAAAGHKAGVKGIALNPFDRIWLEIIIVAILLLLLLLASTLLERSYNYTERVILNIVSLVGLMITLFSVVRRCKAGMLYKTSMLCFFVRFCKTIAHHINMIIGLIGAMAAYGLLQIILIIGISQGNFFSILIWISSNMSLMALICILFIQYDRIRKATDRMASGEFGQLVQENSVSFFGRIARNINSTGNAIKIAVERAMKSERMKTELIANVSHDIKTPLTSIISYVDLLKTTGITNDKALEYIDILDRKSRRLGQLMIDLVEASNVTSGNVSVNMELINLGELVKQAGGEFETRLEKRGIQLVCTLPDTPVTVYADGRHMWRVLDNLFGNASKYALDGTRVYVDLIEMENSVLISVKNISRDPLNIRPEELMERFVRGDESRHTEGSGLGLSIARSLMELQNGTINISIDGDLFKVILSLKKYQNNNKTVNNNSSTSEDT